MATNALMTFSVAPLPTGQAVDGNGYAQAFASAMSANLSGNFLNGQIGGTAPTQNIGPWLNGNQWYVWDSGSNTYIPQTSQSNPSGVILLFAGLVIPSGYLLCDGSLYLRSAYPDLFAAIGISFGAGDGVSTFPVPDFRGRSPMGSGHGAGLAVRPLGTALGQETHALTLSELATHFHGISDPGHTHIQNAHSHGTSDPGHFHTMGISQFNLLQVGSQPVVGFGGATNTDVKATNVSVVAATATNNASVTNVTTTSIGASTPHNVIHPSLVCHFIIKT